MKLLYVSTWLPYPPDNGARARALNLLKYLGRQHAVYLLSFISSAEEEQWLPELHRACAGVQIVRREPFRMQPIRAGLGFLSIRPRGVVGTHSREMQKAVLALARNEQFDAIVAACATVGRYVASVPGVPRLLEEQNLGSRMMWEAYRAERRTAHRLRKWAAWRKALRYERWLYPQFDACSMVSEADRDALLEAVPEMLGSVEVVGNGVDLEWNQPGAAIPQPDTLVYSGALTYRANADAMRFFATEILPAICRERPRARLTITGPSDGVALGWLPTDGSITLSGYLEDVRPAIAGAWASVVPLRIGGGTRLKILESLALGTPVVSTTKGAEGLDLAPGREFLLADRPTEFAEATLTLLRDPALRERLALAGRRAVEERYGWERIGAYMDAWVASVVARRRGRPEAR